MERRASSKELAWICLGLTKKNSDLPSPGKEDARADVEKEQDSDLVPVNVGGLGKRRMNTMKTKILVL